MGISGLLTFLIGGFGLGILAVLRMLAEAFWMAGFGVGVVAASATWAGTVGAALARASRTA